MAEGQKLTDQPETSVLAYVIGAAEIGGGGELNVRKQSIDSLSAQVAQRIGSGDITAATWEELALVAPTFNFQKATVDISDSGQHPQFVAGSGYTGSLVDDRGIYSGRLGTPSGWFRTGNYEDTATLSTTVARKLQIAGTTEGTGTTTAYAVSEVGFAQPQTGERVTIVFDRTNTGACTVSFNGGAALSIRDTTLGQLTAGTLIPGRTYELEKQSTNQLKIISPVIVVARRNRRTSDAQTIANTNLSPDGYEVARIIRDMGFRDTADKKTPINIGARCWILSADDEGRRFRANHPTAEIDAQNFLIGCETGEIWVQSGTCTVNFSPVQAAQISTTASATNNLETITVPSATGIELWQFVLIDNVPAGIVVGISGTAPATITLSEKFTGTTGSGKAVRFSPVPDPGPRVLVSFAPDGTPTTHASTVRQLRFGANAKFRIERYDAVTWNVTQSGGTVPNWATEALTTAPSARDFSMLVALEQSLGARDDSLSGRRGWQLLFAAQNINKDFAVANASLPASSLFKRIDPGNPFLYHVESSGYTPGVGGSTGSGTLSNGPGLAQAIRLGQAMAAPGEGQPAVSIIQCGVSETDAAIINAGSGFGGFTVQQLYDGHKFGINQLKAAFPGAKFFYKLLGFANSGSQPSDGAAFAVRAVLMALAANIDDVYLRGIHWDLPTPADDLHVTIPGSVMKGYRDAIAYANIVEGKSLPRGPYISACSEVVGSGGTQFEVTLHRGGNGALSIPDNPEGFAIVSAAATSYIGAPVEIPVNFDVANGANDAAGEPTTILTLYLANGLPGGTLAYPWSQRRPFSSRRMIRSLVSGNAGYELPLAAFCQDRWFVIP